ncbi:hypothetical protein Pelo_9305 [Pelomyxa schiedti]|nr:hypothetical protein Pelo_9305 [Pelomyxa schiedti]
MVWYCLVLTDPRLLEPLEVSVADKFCVATKHHPLPIHQWMVDFLQSLVSLKHPCVLTASSSTEEKRERDSSLKLFMLAHVLLGLALSQQYGSWPFTDETKSMEHIKTASDGGNQMAQYWLYLKRPRVVVVVSIPTWSTCSGLASQGFCLALHQLGAMYRNVSSPMGVALNREEGLRLLQIGAEKGDSWCQFQMAWSVAEEGDPAKKHARVAEVAQARL